MIDKSGYNVVFDPLRGCYVRLKAKLPIGTPVTTKGKVIGWEGKREDYGKDVVSVEGVGEIVRGPDRFERYEILVAGQRAWVFSGDLITKSRV